jgi:molecular chaperone GrpE (heat shock protein)
MNNRNKALVPLLCVISTIAVLLNSCAETKTAQCQKIFLITKKMAEESAKNRETKDIKAVLQVADAFDQASEELKKLDLKDVELTQYQQGLAEVYRGNAATTRSFVQALESKDIPTAKLAQDQVKQIGKKEQDLVTQTNQYCL